MHPVLQILAQLGECWPRIKIVCPATRHQLIAISVREQIKTKLFKCIQLKSEWPFSSMANFAFLQAHLKARLFFFRDLP